MLLRRFSRGGYSLAGVHRLFIVVFSLAEEDGLQASVVAEHEVQSTESIIVAHDLNCSVACRIFLDQGFEPMFPAWPGGFFTTEPPRKPCIKYVTGKNKQKALTL